MTVIFDSLKNENCESIVPEFIFRWEPEGLLVN